MALPFPLLYFVHCILYSKMCTGRAHSLTELTLGVPRGALEFKFPALSIPSARRGRHRHRHIHLHLHSAAAQGIAREIGLGKHARIELLDL